MKDAEAATKVVEIKVPLWDTAIDMEGTTFLQYVKDMKRYRNGDTTDHIRSIEYWKESKLPMFVLQDYFRHIPLIFAAMKAAKGYDGGITEDRDGARVSLEALAALRYGHYIKNPRMEVAVAARLRNKCDMEDMALRLHLEFKTFRQLGIDVGKEYHLALLIRWASDMQLLWRTLHTSGYIRTREVIVEANEDEERDDHDDGGHEQR